MSWRREVALGMTFVTALAATIAVGPAWLPSNLETSAPVCHGGAPSPAARSIDDTLSRPPGCDLPARLCALACFGVPELAASDTLAAPAANAVRFPAALPAMLSRSADVREPVPRFATLLFG
jgi:hypothetical protein